MPRPYRRRGGGQARGVRDVAGGLERVRLGVEPPQIPSSKGKFEPYGDGEGLERKRSLFF